MSVPSRGFLPRSRRSPLGQQATEGDRSLWRTERQTARKVQPAKRRLKKEEANRLTSHVSGLCQALRAARLAPTVSDLLEDVNHPSGVSLYTARHNSGRADSNSHCASRRWQSDTLTLFWSQPKKTNKWSWRTLEFHIQPGFEIPFSERVVSGKWKLELHLGLFSF